MLRNIFNKNGLNEIVNSKISNYNFTGVGYFLELKNNILPKERIVISEPIIMGSIKNYSFSFVIFIEDHNLTLECHSWGEKNLPESIRDENVEIVI